MARKRKIVVLPRLCDSDGDLKKKWFVEYSMRDPRNDEMKRFRIYEGLDASDEKSRRKTANKLIEELTQKIESGWMPFTNEEKVIYEDELEYSAVAEHYGKMKNSNRCVRVYLSDFLSEKKMSVRKKSYETYVSKIRSFNGYLEMKGMQELDVIVLSNQVIIEFLIYKVREKNLSRLSIEKYQQILHSFFDYLIRRKVIKENPVHDIPQVGIVKDCAPWPIPTEDRKLLAQEIRKRDGQLWLACCIMYYSALRPGQEIRLLKVGDINLESRKIIVHSDLAKNSRTEAVDMPEQLYRELVYHHLELYDKDMFVFGPYGRPGDRTVGKNTLRMRFNRIRDDLGLSKKYKFYSWKHSGAEMLADAGASTWELQAHLRHRRIDTTERYARKRLGNRNERIKKKFPGI